MFSLDRVWIEFRQSIIKFGNYVCKFRLSSDKCSNIKNKMRVILKKILNWRNYNENSCDLC